MNNFFNINKQNHPLWVLVIVLFQLVPQEQVLAQNLKVSNNNRFLVNEDDTPFFWLGDTAWMLFQRLTKNDTEHYLRNRSGKGFTVVQCVLFRDITGKNDPNREGELPFVDKNPNQPNEKYFEHIDWVIDKANEFGIKLAILPVWGPHLEDKTYNFNKRTAYSYGEYLGKRYKNQSNIVWVLGGDRSPKVYEEVWKNMVKGIKDGGSTHLMTYHINGERSSSEFWHTADWLDFNMIQSGHQTAFYDNYELIKKDYEKHPIKPVLEGESMYEGIPIGFAMQNGRANDHHVRVEAYWSVFSGGFGYTYGHNSIRQMYDTDRVPSIGAILTWKEAMETPGSCQMRHLKNLILSRPFLSRIPDQSVFMPEASNRVDHLQATRDGDLGKKNASYMMVYFPFMTHKYKIKTDVIPALKLRIWWYDPRTGTSFLHGEIKNTGIFEIPWGSNLNNGKGGPDWILVIDDASKKYAKPGKTLHQ